ncbi:MAG: response regulator [candidate division FCPU426 bacterium]
MGKPKPASDPKTPAKKCVLVVEDEPDIIMLIHRSLNLKKIKVLEAVSGTAALEMLETSRPDLILLDVMMPDIDGFEVCRRIKQHPVHRDTPVVFLTVRNNSVDIERGRTVGAAGYFTKPFDPFQLGEDIERFLESTPNH